MSDTVISVENLGKKYIIGHEKQERYTALRDVIANGAKSLLKPFQRGKSEEGDPSSEEFWALKDVSFEIKQGDRVGIIGRNGAGKSTLLKILSRITEPTEGRIRIKGRVASLLEVGTGFHPELTGRENIFLNGAILGMGKAEIARKFDEIVAFAEVERFLDTPVKRYSSGMYVRLAFAVAAHLEPEILIVDEVLAVGDAQFQKKCLGKMQEVGKEGRTVLFVSHNMAAISQLCDSAVMLRQGHILVHSDTDAVVRQYLATSSKSQSELKVNRYGVQIIEIGIYDAKDEFRTDAPIFNREYKLKLILNSETPITHSGVVIKIYDDLGILISSICSPEEGLDVFTLHNTIEITFLLPSLQLLPGNYTASVFVHRANDSVTYLEAEEALAFEVQPAIVRDAMWAYRKDHGIIRLSDGGIISKSSVLSQDIR
jgi:lipopolysaccharide transport system ATP-binding protein